MLSTGKPILHCHLLERCIIVFKLKIYSNEKFKKKLQCTVYADLPSFLSPFFITIESYRPDLLLLTDKNILYILELAVGFETNIQNNSDRKATKYSSLINDLSLSLTVNAVGAMGSSCNSLLSLLNDLHFDNTIQKRIIMKTMSIFLRSSYYIFCRRNKPWTNPELLTI